MSDVVEKNLRQCKQCGEKKLRVLAGRFNHKDKKYVDDSGGTWNGNTCPSCHKDKVKHGMRYNRFERRRAQILG